MLCFGKLPRHKSTYQFTIPQDSGFFTDLSAMLAKHNRLEVFAKLPIVSMSITDSKEAILGGNHSPANVTFGASYKFIF